MTQLFGKLLSIKYKYMRTDITMKFDSKSLD